MFVLHLLCAKHLGPRISSGRTSSVHHSKNRRSRKPIANNAGTSQSSTLPGLAVRRTHSPVPPRRARQTGCDPAPASISLGITSTFRIAARYPVAVGVVFVLWSFSRYNLALGCPSGAATEPGTICTCAHLSASWAPKHPWT